MKVARIALRVCIRTARNWQVSGVIPLLLSMTLAPAYGQNLVAGYVAEGRVVNERREGVPNVIVRPINRKTGFREKPVKTNADGVFQITGLQIGVWCLQIYKPGYEAQVEFECRKDPKTGQPVFQPRLEIHGDRKDVAEPNPIPLRRVVSPPNPIRRTSLSVQPDGFLEIVLRVEPLSELAADTGLTLAEQALPVMTGVVVDKQGNPLPGIEVVVFSDQSDATFSAITDERGQFVIEVSEPGRYSVVISTEQYREQTIAVGVKPDEKIKRLGLIRLEPSPDAAQTAAGALLGDAIRRGLFSERELRALPLPGIRTFDSLALLSPGVFPGPASFGTHGPGISSGVGSSGQFAVNGMRSRANNFTVDGSDNNEEDVGVRRQGFVSLVPQPIESVQEFQIITALADARFGRNMGAQVNAVSQYGGRELHGAFYGFFTDRRLNARDFFDFKAERFAGGLRNEIPITSDGTLSGTPVRFDLGSSFVGPIRVKDGVGFQRNPTGDENPFTRLQSGLVISGPVRSSGPYFFGSFERQEIHASVESHFAVPTVAERGLFERGDRGLTLTNGSPVAPASLPGNAILSLFPFPNNPIGPYGPNTYTAILPADGTGTIFSGKLDQNFRWIRNWTHTLTGRYNFTDDESVLPTTGDALFSSLRPQVRTQNLSLLLNTTPSSTTSNTTRFSYGRTSLSFAEVRDPFLLPSRLSDTLLDQAFLLNAPLLLNVTLPGQPPRFAAGSSRPELVSLTETESLTGPIGQVHVAGFSPIGVDVFNFPQGRVNNTFQAADTITFVRGRHIFTGGVDVRRTQINSFVDRNFRPQLVFNGVLNPFFVSGIPNDVQQPFLSGATLAAAGAPSGFFQTLANTSTPNTHIGIRFTQYNFFTHHEFRLPRFILTAGLRYELNTKPDLVDDRLNRSLRETQSFFERFGFAFQQFVDLVKPPFFLVENNFAPRVGLAWDAAGHGRTIVRGGYGLYFDQFLGTVTKQFHTLPTDFFAQNLLLLEGRADFALPLQTLVTPGTLNRLAVAPDEFLRRATDVNLLLLPFSLPRGLKVPYSQQYGLTIEHEWPGQLILSAAYVGTRGVRLLRLTTPDGGLSRIIQLIGADATLGTPSLPGFDLFALFPQREVPLDRVLVPHEQIESSAASTYHSLQLDLRRRYARGVQFGAAFTYSHAIDDASDLFDTRGAYALPQDSRNLRAERASASFDSRYRAVAHGIWDIPYGGQHWLKGRWQLAGILTLQSGQPFTINSTIDVNEDGNLTDRLNRTTGLLVRNEGPTRIELARGVTPANLLAEGGQTGSVGRNTFRAPATATLDMAVSKQFPIRDRHQLVVRAEAFNLLNRSHFGIPVRLLEAPAFGRSVNTSSPARRIQFSVTYSF